MTAGLLALLIAGPAGAQGETDPLKRVDEIFQEWSKPGTPGAAVAVIQSGKIICTKGYGLANLEYDIPVTPQTIYHVASVSKQFTAMALVLLEQDGNLSLEDDLHKYLPELPEYGSRITIRQLLQHTSGIRDQWQTLAIAGWRLDDVIESVLTPIAKDRFVSTQWFMPEVQFRRDSFGGILPVTLGGGRVTGIRFDRSGRNSL
jgi:CubicO group peptidase (beta-lactamase class C family)